MRRSAILFICCLIAAAMQPPAAHAVSWKAWIEGQVKDPGDIASSTPYQTVDNNQKSYTISSATLNGADGSQDNIRFHNTVITANNDAVVGHIYFWGDYNPSPSGTVTFTLSASGTITRKVLTVTKAATNSTFSVSGWVQHPTDASPLPGDGTSGSWTHISYPYNPTPPAYTLNVVCDSVASCGTISFATPTPGYQQSSVNDVRIMKGEIWFYLHKKNDKLTLNLDSGVNVQTSGGGGKGGGLDGGEGTGGLTCPQCCYCPPCKEEPPHIKYPIDKAIFQKIPLPTLKDYLSEREKEDIVPLK